MSKRALAAAAVGITVLVLGVMTWSEQRDLHRFDSQMVPLLDDMNKAIEPVMKHEAEDKTFWDQLPRWKVRADAIVAPESGYRAQLAQSVKGFFTDIEKMKATTPARLEDPELMMNLADALAKWKQQAVSGPQGEGDEH